MARAGSRIGSSMAAGVVGEAHACKGGTPSHPIPHPARVVLCWTC
jgi:hypothetical protein